MALVVPRIRVNSHYAGVYRTLVQVKQEANTNPLTHSASANPAFLSVRELVLVEVEWVRYTRQLARTMPHPKPRKPIGVYMDPLDQPPIGIEAQYGLAPAVTTTLLPNSTLSLQGYFVT
ncbi:MAG TPA: hypothetical protein EYP33_02145 [Pyrodictium sp.]|nr:hypothetical protein [Pyrodictium sp.]